jgi:hypothetical protein
MRIVKMMSLALVGALGWLALPGCRAEVDSDGFDDDLEIDVDDDGIEIDD